MNRNLLLAALLAAGCWLPAASVAADDPLSATEAYLLKNLRPETAQAPAIPEPREIVQAAPAPADLTARLTALLPDHPFVIAADRAAALRKQLGLSERELLQALVPVAKSYARPPISNYFVGAAGLGRSGRIYLGVNLEFPGNALNQAVHGEQFVVVNAWRNGETGLSTLAVSAAPCGHCRQFLNETAGGGDLVVLTPQSRAARLKRLLPASFGPADLGVNAALLSPQDQGLQFGPGAAVETQLAQQALVAANAAYAPYSKEPSGVALRLKDGSIYRGSYAENAAFNPSLSPLQAALIGMVADGRQYSEIESVALAEPADAKASQIAATRTLLESLGVKARLRVLPVVRRPAA